MDFLKRKQELQAQLQQKAQSLQNVENIRTQLIQDINKLQGKIELLEEQINEKQPKDNDSKTPREPKEA